MKSILLTTTAIVAFAGAAVADGHTGVSFTGAATLGINDDVEDGFYWDAEIDTTMSAELDNGITASATFGLNVVDGTLSDPVETSDFVLELSTENAALRYGDVDPVAEANWSGVDGASVADFNDLDTHLNPTEASEDGQAELESVGGVLSDADLGAGFDAMLMGEITYSGWTGMFSLGVENDGEFTLDDPTIAVDNGFSTDDDVDALQVYVSGTAGPVDVQLAYQDEFNGTDAIYGIALGASVAGADVDFSYIDDGAESSIGLGAAYPVGPVTLSGYYSVNDPSEDSYGVAVDYAQDAITVTAFYDFTGGATDENSDNTQEFGVEGSYAVSEQWEFLAGYIYTDGSDADDSNAYYVATTYDLGGGAELLLSYAEDEGDDDNDEIGDPEYNSGTTVQVTFSF